MEFRIGSINAMGFGDRTKRREVFNGLRRQQFSIYFIQEAHRAENNMHDWRAEWGYQALFSCCTGKKVGITILFNNNFAFHISRTYCDLRGHFIVCDMTTNGEQLSLINVYAPNDHNPTFFNSVFEHLDDFKCGETIMIGGDYNLVLDVEIDQRGGLPNTYKKSRGYKQLLW